MDLNSLDEGTVDSDEDENTAMTDSKHISSNHHNWGEKIREMEAEIVTRRQQLEMERGMADAEKRQLAEELLLREEELRKTKEEHQKLATKLANIEKKLIVGGENMLEKAEKQAQLLEESNAELEKAKHNENELRRRLESRQAEHLNIEEQYNSLQEEAIGKSKKLKKIWSSYMQAKGELSDLDAEHQREMEGLLDNVRQLQKELKLYGTLIDSYIPQEYMKMIEKYVFWNDDIGDWQLKCIAYTGNNMRAAKHNPPLVYRVGRS